MALIINVDRKTRSIALSIKARTVQDEKEAVSQYSKSAAAAGTTNLGDLLKEQMKRKKEEDK